jgi:threonine/homoserine/homoserine lactone efflux protein
VPAPDKLWLFVLAAALLALTPGPNWLYLTSRTLCQGRRAGLVSLAGTTSGVGLHMVAAAFGLTALLAAVPMAFEVIRFCGAIYLLWLAIATLRGAGLTFEPRVLPAAADAVLFRDGIVSGILNPKVALFYLALFPQFLDPAGGAVLAQSLLLGVIQIAVAILIDGGLVMMVGILAVRLARHPGWMATQRWVLGGAFGLLAAWLLLDTRRT